MTEFSFCIKEGYTINKHPSYFRDNKVSLVYQPDAYELAYYLAKRSKAKYVIDIGCGNGEKLKKFEDEFRLLAIDYGENLGSLKRNVPKAETFEFNLEQGLPNLKDRILKDSIVIFSDVVEHLLNPDKVLRALSNVSYKSKFMIITTPDRVRARGVGDFGPPANPCHVREWSLEEFDSLLRFYKFNSFMIGYTVNTDFHLWKNNILVLSGRYCKPNIHKTTRVLAIINVYNEVDIIEEVINHLLNQGIDVKVIDNWSKDGSYELVTKMSRTYPQVTVRRFPETPNEYYQWEQLLRNVENEAKRSNYDWIIHHDADEIRLSPWKEFTLNEAISFVDYLGFNAIDFTVLDFRPTDEDINLSKGYENCLRYFEFGRRPGHFLQVKAWKNINNVAIDLASSGGHEIKFFGRKVYPIKFLIKHYPLRSPMQAKKKIFEDRLTRVIPEEKARGWHTQYDAYTPKDNFIWNKELLLNWNSNVFEVEFLVERISGIGLIRKKKPLMSDHDDILY